MRRLSACLFALALCAPRAAAAADAAAQPAPAAQAQPAAPAVQPAQTAQPLTPPPPPPPPPPPAPAAPGEMPPPPPPPVLMQPDPAQPVPAQPAPQPVYVPPQPAQPGVMQPVPAQPGVMVPVPVQQAPAPTYAPRKMFHWGVGMSGGIGGGVSNYPGSAGFGLALLNVDGRFLIGTRMPDVGGGYLHAGLIDVHLGVRVGFTAGDYATHTLFGPLWMAGGGLDLGYQLLKLRPYEPNGKEKAQTAIGVAVGVSMAYEYFGRALLASVSSGNSTDLTDKVAGGGLNENTHFLVGPFIELSTPKYDPVKGKLKQKFMRLMLLNGGNALYQVSLTWGSTF